MTRRPSFAVRDGWLELRSETGALTAVRPDDLSVVQVLQLDATSAILLLEPPTGTGRVHNLLKVTADGAATWHAELPPASGPTDAFVSFRMSDDDTLVASTWSGYRVTVDQTTGLILSQDFTK